jgi:hypothetical protein
MDTGGVDIKRIHVFLLEGRDLAIGMGKNEFCRRKFHSLLVSLFFISLPKREA